VHQASADSAADLHLNGKVEPAQTTTLDEFYATTTLDSPTLQDDLEDWLTDYNHHRVHGSLGRIPMQRWVEKSELAPLWEEIAATVDRNKEANYVDVLWFKRHRKQASKKVKPCVQISQRGALVQARRR
jgi:transposase InsO family protein